MATQYTDLAYKTIAGQEQKEVFNPTTGKTYGTPEQLAADLGISPTQIDWSKIGTGMNAGEVGQGNLQIPQAQSYNPTNAINYWQSTAAGLQQQIKDYQAQMEKTMGAMTTNQTSMVDTMNQQYEKWGVQGMFDQIKTWSEEANAVRENIATLQDQENQALLSAEGQQVSLATIKGRQSIIARQYDSKIAAESARLAGYGAMIESTRGNLSMAQSFVSQFVEAATYDYQVKRDTLQQFYNYNKDMFSYLGSQYESAVKNMVDSADREYQFQLDEKNKVAELMLTYPTAGINAQDTYETALAKAQAPAAQAWNAKMSGGGNTIGFSQWASELGIVGMTEDEAMKVIEQKATQIKDSQKSLVKLAAQNWITDNKEQTREQLIQGLVSDNRFDQLTLDEIAAEVYAATKTWEEGNKPRKKFLGIF